VLLDAVTTIFQDSGDHFYNSAGATILSLVKFSRQAGCAHWWEARVGSVLCVAKKSSESVPRGNPAALKDEVQMEVTKTVKERISRELHVLLLEFIM